MILKKRIHNTILSDIKTADDIVSVTHKIIELQINENLFQDRDVVQELYHLTTYYLRNIKDE